ncbi:MAG TPA: efflux transporter outer membrane subunit [Chthoniobacteraceae bacterium]|nr:efflux transporter outer membrane subunit [Chthoniobacteraceae bacterium]
MMPTFPRTLRLALLGTALPLLVSCVGSRPASERSGVPVPAAWRAGGDGALDVAALAHWWRRFRDPVLDELIARAFEGSPDLRTSVSRIREARARRGLATSAFFPTVSGRTSGRTERSKNHDLNIVTESERYSASLDASWEIDLFGKQFEQYKASSADYRQAVENFFSARVSLAAEVAEVYMTLRSAEEQARVVEQNLSLREETVQLTRWRAEAGQTSELDLQQAISTLEQARGTLPALRQSVLQNRNQLALLCGLTPGGLDAVLAKPRGLPKLPPRLAVGIPAEALRQRPDVRAAEEALLAATARTEAAWRERLPTLSLSGTIGIEALKAGRLFSPQSSASSLVGTLAAPIFDAGRIRQNIRIQNEQEKQALIAYEATVLRALSEVENALIAIRQTAERLAVLDNARAAALAAAVLAQQQYEAGLVDLTVVLDAQRVLLSIEEQQMTTRANQLSAHIQLYKALGGGWQPE